MVRFRRNENEAKREVCARALHTIADAVRIRDIDRTMAELERSFVVIQTEPVEASLDAVPRAEPPRRIARGSGPIRTWLRAHGCK